MFLSPNFSYFYSFNYCIFLFSNNKLLDVVGNYYGTNETNIILSGDNPKNTVKTVNVTFAKKGYGDFNIKYLKFFVYKNENGDKKLVDKFIYKT